MLKALKNNASAFFVSTLLAALALTSIMCTGTGVYREANSASARLDQFLLAGDYDGFLEAARTMPFYKAGKNELITSLDVGLARVYAGSPETGAVMLARVGNLSEKYYTKSLLRQTLSVFTNDLTLPYTGEDYEVSFASNAAALAYAASGDIENALVEARRSEHRLNLISDSWQGGDAFRDDALAHYLAGMFYEADGRIDDARISYTMADKAYGDGLFPMKPAGVAQGLKRVSGDIRPDFASAQSDTASTGNSGPVVGIVGDVVGGVKDGVVTVGSTVGKSVVKIGEGVWAVGGVVTKLVPDFLLPFSAGPDSLPQEPRTIVFCAMTGRGPVKDETVIQAHFTDDGIDYLIKMALPQLRKRPGRVRGVRVCAGDRKIPLELAADYSGIAQHAFKKRLPMMYAKTLARVSARYLVVRSAKEDLVKDLQEDYEKAKKKHGSKSSEAFGTWLKLKGASLGIDMLANELLEHADTRSSLLMPELVFASPLTLPPGVHEIKVEFLDAAGTVINSETRTIDTTAAETPAAAVFTSL